MTAIITGDIINSENAKASEWIPILKTYLSTIGETPTDWEIYRGDEFQIKTSPSEALRTAIQIKTLIKSIKGLDVRIGIGVGDETFKGKTVSESNGTAYQNSGRIFETLKEQKLNLAFASHDKEYDQTLNLILKLGLEFMDNWTIVSAEIVALALQQPKASQKEIAAQLFIKQSAVSQRQKRARLEMVLEILTYYNTTIEHIKS